MKTFRVQKSWVVMELTVFLSDSTKQLFFFLVCQMFSEQFFPVPKATQREKQQKHGQFADTKLKPGTFYICKWVKGNWFVFVLLDDVH